MNHSKFKASYILALRYWRLISVAGLNRPDRELTVRAIVKGLRMALRSCTWAELLSRVAPAVSQVSEVGEMIAPVPSVFWTRLQIPPSAPFTTVPAKEPWATVTRDMIVAATLPAKLLILGARLISE